MNTVKPALAALLATLASASAQANFSTSTVGAATVYTETFQGGSSFSGGGHFAAGSDDFLWLTAAAPSASFSFMATQALASLQLGFWYSGPSAQDNGQVTFGGLTSSLGNTPGSATQFLLNNPGPDQGGVGNSGGSFDRYFSTTLTNLAVGHYTISFQKAAGALNSLKIDDVTLTALPVPEPQTYATLLAGLGVVGFVARRRRPR